MYGEEGIDGNMGNGGDPMDMFNDLFGGMGMGGHPFSRMNRDFEGRSKRKGESVIKPLDLTLEHIFNGKKIKASMERIVIDKKKIKKCSRCDGKGQVMKFLKHGPMMIQQSQTCPDCNGVGYEVSPGAMSKKKEIIEIDVPVGCEDGQKFVFEGKTDESPGVLPGDLIFIAKIKEHPTFKRIGVDLMTTMDITLAEALTGFDRKIKHLNNEKIKIRSDKIIKPNDKKTISGLGFIYNGQIGNLHITFNIEFPNKIDKSTELLNILNQESKHYPFEQSECSYLEEYQPTRDNPFNNMDPNTSEENGQEGVQCQQQ